MSEASKNDRLKQAAEALVEAANMEVDTVNQQKLADNVDALKESFDTKLNAVTQSVKATNDNFDAKIDTVNQHLVKVQEEVSEVKALLETHMAQQRFAMKCIKYRISEGGGSRPSSADLAKKFFG